MEILLTYIVITVAATCAGIALVEHILTTRRWAREDAAERARRGY